MSYERNVVLINSSNYIPGTNRFVYKFPQPMAFQNAKISVQNVAMYNSTFNITEQLGNNRYSIIWTNNTRYDFIIPDGYYSLSELNTRMQFDMTNQGLYCNLPVNSQTVQQAVFFITISANSVRYKSQLLTYYVPNAASAAQLRYTLPPNATWNFDVTNHICPQVFFAEPLLKLLGFPGNEGQNTFPSSRLTSNAAAVPSPISFLSRLAPQVSPVFSYIFTTNLVNSTLNNVPGVLLQLPLTASFGSLIVFNNASDDFKLDIRPGFYGSIELTLLDQQYNPLNFKDPDVVITLVVHTLQ